MAAPPRGNSHLLKPLFNRLLRPIGQRHGRQLIGRDGSHDFTPHQAYGVMTDLPVQPPPFALLLLTHRHQDALNLSLIARGDLRGGFSLVLGPIPRVELGVWPGPRRLLPGATDGR